MVWLSDLLQQQTFNNTSRISAYLTLDMPDLHRTNLFKPAAYISASVPVTLRDTEYLCGPSPSSPRDVPGAQVPTPCFPCSPEMQLGARDASIPNGLVSSGLGLEAPSQTAEHDTGSLTSHASRLTDQTSDNRDTSGCCPPAGAGHLVLSLIHISEPRDQRGSRMPSSA